MALNLFLHYRFSHDMPVEINIPVSNMYLYMAIILNAKNAKDYIPYLKRGDSVTFPNIISTTPSDFLCVAYRVNSD